MGAIFDAGGVGLVLIAMPGLEKRLARHAQFYSRIGFVHEIHPLNASEMRRPLSEGAWGRRSARAIKRVNWSDKFSTFCPGQ